MAGIDAMGELAHELESLVGRIEIGRASADESAPRAVVSARKLLDELARMREATASGRPASHVPALIARIRSVAAGEQRRRPIALDQRRSSPWVEEPLAGQAPIRDASPADVSAAEVSPIVASSEQAGDTVMLPMPEPEWRPEPEQSPEPEFQSSPEWPLAPDSAPPPALASDAAAEQPAAVLPADEPVEQTVVLTLTDLKPRESMRSGRRP